MSAEQYNLVARVMELESTLYDLKKEFDNFKKFKIDRHISWNCASGKCKSCKGRSCRHDCHNDKMEAFE